MTYPIPRPDKGQEANSDDRRQDHDQQNNPNRTPRQACRELATRIRSVHKSDYWELGRPRSDAGLGRGDCGLPRFCRPTDTRREALTPGSIRSVDSRAGVQNRSDQFVTSGSSLPVVQPGPDHPKVVHPCGSQRGSRPAPARGTTMVFKSIRDSRLVTAATCVAGVQRWLAKQGHPAYNPAPEQPCLVGCELRWLARLRDRAARRVRGSATRRSGQDDRHRPYRGHRGEP